MRKFSRPFLASLCTLLSASLAFPATSPEDFVKVRNAAPAAAFAASTPVQATPAPATPAPATTVPAGTKAAPAAKPAVKAAKTPAPVDTAKVHDQYLEGDFDQAIRALEVYIKSARTMTHAESVFVYKHLGVMYAAQNSTRDKGKHYMHQLIAIEPTAKILDMYASDMIHLIFRNVQEEFEVKRVRLAPQPETTAAPEAQAAAPAPASVEGTSKSDGKNKTLFMAAAGAAVAVGGLTLFLVLSDDEPKTRTIKVTE